MSSSFPEPELPPESMTPFEAELKSMVPSLGHFQRDEVLFASGEQAAKRRQRRTLRVWQGLCCGLLVGLIVQSVNPRSEEPDALGPTMIAAPTDVTPLAPGPLEPPRPIEPLLDEENRHVAIDEMAKPTGELAMGDVITNLFESMHNSNELSAQPGLRSGSLLRDVEVEPQFIPRASQPNSLPVFPMLESRRIR